MNRKQIGIFCGICLTALSLFALVGCNGYEKYDDAALYSVGSSSVSAVSSVDIEWTAGSVNVVFSAEATEVIFEETDTADDSLKLHYLDRAGELDIEFAASKAKIPSGFSKDLIVILPLTITELDITADTASVNVTGAPTRELHAETRSGSVTLVLGEIEGFICEFETKSGNFDDAFGSQLRERNTYLFGRGGLEIDVETKSGNLSLKKTAG